jgi:hypothetical protein
MNTTISTSTNNAAPTTTKSASKPPSKPTGKTKTTQRAIQRMLILSLLPAAVGAQASCLTDAPEIGDIGPGSDLVCDQLRDQFPGAALAIENRVIHSPTGVSVLASVNGAPIELRYDLTGYVWHLTSTDTGMADHAAPEQGLSMRE